MRAEIAISAQGVIKSNIQFDASKSSPQINKVNNAEITNPSNAGLSLPFQYSGTTKPVISSLNGLYKVLPEEGYPGYISKTISDADGVFAAPLPQVVFSTTPTTVTVYFVDGYPIDFTVKCGDIIDTYKDNKKQVISFNCETAGEYTITVSKWSVGNSSLKISRIISLDQFVFTENDLIDFKCSENLLDSQVSIQPGICEQYADITIYDRHKLLYRYVVEYEHELTNGTVRLLVYDDNNNVNVIGAYVITDYDISGQSLQVNLTCSDPSYKLEKIQIPAISPARRTIADMIDIVVNYGNIPIRYADTSVYEQCTLIFTPNCWFKADNALNILNKICQLGMLRLYWYIDTFVIGTLL